MQSQPKKFQVFVSSTYLDMPEERQAAVKAILDAGHIPAGMELFAANDQSQWDTITNWIDESDVFLLILGGRYGSIEEKSQKSYVELEYDYAIEKEKPFFAIVISEAALNTKVRDEGTKVIESDDSKKLKEFRAKVLTKMVTEFNSLTEIELTIHKSLKLFEKNKEIIGWVRPTANNDFSPLLEELKIVRKEKGLLDKELSKIKVVEPKHKEYESLIILLNDEQVDISHIKNKKAFLSYAKKYFFKKYSYSNASQIPDAITLLDLFIIFWKQLKNGIPSVLTKQDDILALLIYNATLLQACQLLENYSHDPLESFSILDQPQRLSSKGCQFLQYVLLKKIDDPKSC